MFQVSQNIDSTIESKVRCTSRDCKVETTASYMCLLEHCRIVHGWKDIPCSSDNCNFVAYNSKSSLYHKHSFHAKHKTHNPRGFDCNWVGCKSSFDRHFLLEKHKRIHTNNLSQCVYCPYRTNEPSDLANHYRVHYKMFHYKCEICDRLFVNKKGLRFHHVLVHEDEKLTCHICKKYTETRFKVQSHVRQVHKLLCRWNEKEKKIETFSYS